MNGWGDTVGVLLHEAMEMSLMMSRSKYRTVPMSNYDSTDVTFMFDHAEFGRSCADVGCFMGDTLPKLHAVYMRHLKRKK
jgi:hypothetical protein